MRVQDHPSLYSCMPSPSSQYHLGHITCLRGSASLCSLPDSATQFHSCRLVRKIRRHPPDPPAWVPPLRTSVRPLAPRAANRNAEGAVPVLERSPQNADTMPAQRPHAPPKRCVRYQKVKGAAGPASQDARILEGVLEDGLLHRREDQPDIRGVGGLRETGMVSRGSED